MNEQLIISYVKKLKNSVIILIIGLIICIAVIQQKLIPEITEFSDKNKEITKQTTAIDENTKKLAALKKSVQEKAEQNNDAIKEIFKPTDVTISAESAISEEFDDVLKMLRTNLVKARSVKYKYNPSNDNFVSKASNQYNVCLLSLEMIADYKHFQSFLRDLYKHEHFLDISDIEIIPYEKDKKILLIKSNIKLYSRKNGIVDNTLPKQEIQDETQAENITEETNSET